jgi:hypothetical protein
VLLLLGATALLVGLGLLKPWQPTGDAGRIVLPTPSTDPSLSSPSSAPTPRPTPAPTPDREAVPCISSNGWRVVAREQTAGRETQTWIAIEPRPATGPGDPAIPRVRLVAGTLRGLGYCLPDRLQQVSHMGEAWSLGSAGSQPPQPAALELVPLSAAFRGYADLYAPPSGMSAWPAGQYVFAVDVGVRERVWFSVLVTKAASDEGQP